MSEGTAWSDMSFKTCIQSPDSTKSSICDIQKSISNRKFILEQFDWSLTTNYNPKTWHFNPRTPNPRTNKFFSPRAAHFVLVLIKFYGTPLQSYVTIMLAVFPLGKNNIRRLSGHIQIFNHWEEANTHRMTFMLFYCCPGYTVHNMFVRLPTA